MAGTGLGGGSALADRRNPQIEVVAELNAPPGGICVTPKGEIIVSIHQFFRARERLVRIDRDGKVHPFPSAGEGGETGLDLDSVLGLACDGNGVVWMLDNGRRGESIPKLVGWDTAENQLHRIIHLTEPATVAGSFVSGLTVDEEGTFAYITDPARGQDAALIVVNLDSGLARRVLEGHFSVRPEADMELRIDNGPIEARGLDGAVVDPQAGVNPITMGRKQDWIYYGPMKGRTLYRLRTRLLKDTSLTQIELASRVEGYAARPVCDGIGMDNQGNIYLSDLAGKAVGIIEEKTQKYRPYITDPRLLWLDGFAKGTDGQFYGFTTQLHRSPHFNRGKNSARPPFYIFKFKPLASGLLGR